MANDEPLRPASEHGRHPSALFAVGWVNGGIEAEHDALTAANSEPGLAKSSSRAHVLHRDF